jgi:LCP family protein required for cell wall assembly
MLIRLDPDQAVTSVLSLPRDLKVLIPGHGLDKINDAYSLGGPTLTLQTIEQLTGLRVNHVVNVNFHGFKEAVDAVGCVYLDVDRRYLHSNRGVPIGQRYSAIDVQPGYQRLCGADALAYVRYRHTDSDIVRAARQQDFLRAAKDQVSSSQLVGQRARLVDIFATNTQTDAALDTTNGLLRILKLALFSAGHPVRQIQFPAQFTKETLPGGAEIDYVTATPYAIQRTVQRFLHPAARAPRPSVQLTPRSRRHRRAATGPSRVAGLVDARRAGEDVVARAIARGGAGVPIYFPSRLTVTSRYAASALRSYAIHDRAGRPHAAYRLVVAGNPIEGQYWGVQGTDWRSPPILQASHDRVTRHGRRLSVYRDGSRIRLVAWRTPGAVYWVSNTLSSTLTNSQMLEIASTLTHRISASVR